MPESRQTFQMLAHEYRRCHEAAVRVVDELSDEQFRWRPSAGPQSIGWNLWHIARWDDYTAEVLMANTPSLAHLGPARQVWRSQDLAGRWGLTSTSLGLEDAGTSLTDVDAAALQLPSKEKVVGYARDAFDHLDAVLPELDDSLLTKILPTVSTESFPGDDPYCTTVVIMLNHAYEHLGTIEALKGMLGFRGSVTD